MSRASQLLALAVGLAGCGRGCAEVPAAVDGPPIVLLVAVDTLRADHLGVYGYGPPTSPRIDQLLSGSVTFDDAHSTSNWTLPAFASVMTSTLPSTHGCWQFTDALPPSATTLAEVLSDAGWHTEAVVGHVFLGSKYGLDQGFSAYDESLVAETLDASHEAVTSPVLTDRALAILEARASAPEPTLLWVHYFDPHSDYQVHDGITEAFGTTPKARYDGEIAFTDQHVGRLLDGLDALGLRDRTIVVFVADHGEEFSDHGRRQHGLSLYREVERVPLGIRVPGVAPRRVTEAVSLVDLMPTVLELVGVHAPDGLAGRSVAPLVRGGSLPPVDLWLESRLEWRKDATLAAVVHGDDKLIVETSRADGTEVPLLFDRRRDPTERHDRAAQEPELVAELRARLAAAVDAAAARALEGVEVGHDEPELQQLRDLGYLEGGDGGD